MPKPSSQEVTNLLLTWCQGKQEALDRLMPIVYEELRRQAVPDDEAGGVDSGNPTENQHRPELG